MYELIIYWIIYWIICWKILEIGIGKIEKYWSALNGSLLGFPTNDV